ncbi:YihY/virulence factor BrkB family protein [Rhizobium sp. XQZ8]|uniref:YihY/virulence factor BrkB family protein n=1 Tax=Rhizobium populisoli TaxID=2859785 RepID=UPI001C66B5A8|nr:YihY/virulence factor BrkB family protein [Rhizobium populisoli]MBW6424833.1 YihY/virulence factor BrkB family protein [Rhizobium populisoli]
MPAMNIIKKLPIATIAFGLAVSLLLVKNRHQETLSSERQSEPVDMQRGRHAEVPEAIPAKGLLDVFWRLVEEVSQDRVMLIAAGVTFYLLLALFPGLTALVSIYGLIADPMTISDHLAKLSGLLPPGAFDIICEQIKSLARRSDGTLGVTFFVGLSVALWSAHSGVLSIFDAMNVAYDEEEKRSFIRLNLIGLAFTLCFVVAAVALVALVAVLPALLSYLWLNQFQEQMALILRWPLLLSIVIAAVMTVYRVAPSREPAHLRWLTWGAALAICVWFVMSLAFSFYLTHFADYNATYGTLGALIGFLVWTWISVAILIVGAELNAELEHQTTRDTTTGMSRPMGSRGAYVADTVGDAKN